jgi:hypothetical protein
MKPRETEVAAPVVAWLEGLGWDVYQEVSGYDIVARVGPIVWIVEVKTSLSTKLCAQAFNRCRHAHYVSVAIPVTNGIDDGHRWATDRLEDRGIGVLHVDLVSMAVDLVSMAVKQASRPSLHRRVDVSRLLSSLRPEHKTYLAAGSPCGGGWTPWKAMCLKILQRVAGAPGITLKELLATDGRYHYTSEQSARSALSHWIRVGRIPGVECRRDGRSLRLYPVEK